MQVWIDAQGKGVQGMASDGDLLHFTSRGGGGGGRGSSSAQVIIICVVICLG